MFWFLFIATTIHFSAAGVLYCLLFGVPRLQLRPTQVDQSAKSEERASPADQTSGAPEQAGGEWLARLQAEGIVARSVVEAVTQITRLDAIEYRDKLVAMEDQLRAAPELDAETLAQLATSTQALLQERLAHNESTAAEIEKVVKPLNEAVDLADAVENVLLDEAAQAETTLSNLAASSDTLAADKLLAEVVRLIACANTVRTKMVDVLLSLTESTPDICESLAQVRDLERHIQFLAEINKAMSATPPRDLMVALIDVDQFGKANSSFGHTIGDTVIREIETLFKEVAVDEGELRVTRGCGATYGVSFAGVPKDVAVAKVEKMCQTLSATEFTSSESTLTLSATAALVEGRSKDSVREILKQLAQLVLDARKTGPNRLNVAAKSGSSSFEITRDQSLARSVSVDPTSP